MRLRGVARLVGQLLGLFSLVLLVHQGVDCWYRQDEYVFLLAAMIGLALSAGAYLWGRQQDYFTVRDGFLTVTVVWVLAIFIGALPFVIGQVLPTWTDALFEATSGLTTTGGSVISDVSALRPSYIVWRSLLHWLGGVGIIVLLVGFIKSLGAQGGHFFYTESSVKATGGLIPRVRQIARQLCLAYGALTLACILALYGAGLSLFDAINYAFSIMGEGGFAPSSEGPLIFENNILIMWIMIIFMALAGGNFAIYAALMQRRRWRLLWSNSEMRLYGLLLMGGATLVGCGLWLSSDLALGQAFSTGAFMYVSMQVGAGFAIADYTQWFMGLQTILFIAMFIGGCTGSMTGGIKVSRLLILWRDMIRSLRHGAHPDLIASVRINNQAVDQRTIDRAGQFFFLYLLIFTISTLLLTGTGLSVSDSLGLAAGALGNVGLAFGAFGPIEGFAALNTGAKIICILDMILGRLELFTVLVLCMPSFWKSYLGK